MVSGDLPPAIRSHVNVEMSVPLTIIFNTITSSGVWPSIWKQETGTPLPKVQRPQTADDIRIVSVTSSASKTYKKQVLLWLLQHLQRQLDSRQFGGSCGAGCHQYLIECIIFISSNADLPSPKATVDVAMDLTKAFNRMNHNLVVRRLAELAVPCWLIKVVIAFLTDRNLTIKWRKERSGKVPMPAGGPQGTILGQFIFILLFKGVGPNEPEHSWGETLALPPHLRHPPAHSKAIFVDDLFLLSALDLKKTEMEIIPEHQLVRPVPPRQKWELRPVNPAIQTDLENLENFTKPQVSDQ